VDLGKRLMRNRKPINVNGFAVGHNIVMFCASLYMVIETLRQVTVALHLDDILHFLLLSQGTHQTPIPQKISPRAESVENKHACICLGG